MSWPLSEPASPNRSPALVLSPHPDDAVLGCWSVLDQDARAVTVVNVFAGLPPEATAGGWDRECGVPDSREMMRRRRREDERALALVAITPIHLAFLDRQYADTERDSAAIAATIDRLIPQRSAVYAPAATGGFTILPGTPGLTLAPHPDHEVVRAVALHLRLAGVPTYLYAEIPYASGDAQGANWPYTMERFTPVIEAAIGHPLELVLREHPAESLNRRLHALAQYRTQLPRLQEGVGRFIDDRTILRHEAYWRL
jgi:LmbE family N-acetylglucosaminyl deacetylase